MSHTKPLDIEKFWFYKSGNPFTGSAGKLRFLIKPQEEALLLYTWTTDLCFEKAEHGEPESYPLSEEGLEQIRAVLTEKADAC